MRVSIEFARARVLQASGAAAQALAEGGVVLQACEAVCRRGLARPSGGILDSRTAGEYLTDGGALLTLQVVRIGMSPRKSRLPMSTPQ